MLRDARIAFRLFVLLTLCTGVLYPAVVTGAAALLAPRQAAGSPLFVDGVLVGSEWVGQPFVDPAFFAGRPSATAARPYNSLASSGSNLGPNHPALQERIAAAVAQWRATPGVDPVAPLPADLVTASGSGLDPHVTPAGARLQIARVAAARRASEATVAACVEECVELPLLGLFGQPRVNVLRLNLLLERRLPRQR